MKLFHIVAEFADMAGIVDFRLIGSDPACIMNVLCDLYDGIAVEAKTIKEYWLKPKIRNMMEQGVGKLSYLNLNTTSLVLIFYAIRKIV